MTKKKDRMFLDRSIYNDAISMGYKVKYEKDFNVSIDDETVFSEFRAPNDIHVYCTKGPNTMGHEYGYWEVSLHDENLRYLKRDGMISIALAPEALHWILKDTARGSYDFQRKRKHWFEPEDDPFARSFEKEQKFLNNDLFEDFDEDFS